MESARKRIQEYVTEFDGLNLEFERAAQEEKDGEVFLSLVEQEFAAIEHFIRESQQQAEGAKERLQELEGLKAGIQNELNEVRVAVIALGGFVAYACAPAQSAD